MAASPAYDTFPRQAHTSLQYVLITMSHLVPVLTPMIEVDHTPKVHPASPSESLPNSFASYRQKAQQHGPLKGGSKAQESSQSSSGLVGGRAGASLGSIQPAKGEFFDRDELPARFRRTRWTQAEMDAIDSGGASLFG